MEKINFGLIQNLVIKLVKNGYDKNTAVKLCFEYAKVDQQMQLNKVSNALDDYLLKYVVGRVPENNKFGILIPMTEEEKEEKKYDGVFYQYSCHLHDKLGYLIRSDKLINIFNLDYHCIPKELEPYLQELFDPNNYEDLCELDIIGIKETFYITLSAFKQLLESKGITEECYLIVFGEYGMGSNYPRKAPNEGVYINSYKPDISRK